MSILMDKILQECAEQAYEATRLGRCDLRPRRDRVFVETLAELESIGDAMRFVDGKGRIAWRATPNLRDHLTNLELDAEADLEDF
jgi:hypothetical protein